MSILEFTGLGPYGCADIERELRQKIKARDAEITSLVALQRPQVSVTTQQLIDLLVERDRAGLAKYGVSLDRTDLSHAEWLQHLTEEALDAAGYAQAAIRTIKGT